MPATVSAGSMPVEGSIVASGDSGGNSDDDSTGAAESSSVISGGNGLAGPRSIDSANLPATIHSPATNCDVANFNISSDDVGSLCANRLAKTPSVRTDISAAAPNIPVINRSRGFDGVATDESVFSDDFGFESGLANGSNTRAENDESLSLRHFAIRGQCQTPGVNDARN